jgi:hypothetical protein
VGIVAKNYAAIEKLVPNTISALDKTELAARESQNHADKTYTATVKMLNIMLLTWDNKSVAQKAASFREQRSYFVS